MTSSAVKQMEASKEPKIVSMDTTKPEVSETNKEKQIEKVVSMEKKVEVCKIIYIYVSCEFLSQ